MTLSADALYGFFSYGTIQKDRLTKAATSYTASEYLFDRAVVYYLYIRNDKVIGIITLVHIHHNALFDDFGSAVKRSYRVYCAVIVIADIIQRRHIHALDICGEPQKLGSAPALSLALAVELDDLEIDLFAVAEEEYVDEIGYRLGIAGTGTAGYYDMLKSVSVL